ncbi:MAG: hypothetical protein WC360_00995 [Opitutales bacterium]|jgi:hypothetical protein
MTPRILPIFALLSIFSATGVQAQLLTKDTASGDNIIEFNKRMPRKPTSLNNVVREAEATGWNLYRYEALADAASFVLAENTQPAERSAITGSIVIPGEQWRVRFFSKDGADNYAPVADVLFDVDNGTTVVPAGAVAPFSAPELAMIKAQELVEGTQPLPCEDSEFKTIVLPAPSGSGFWVYRVRESMQDGRFPEGQHVRYEVSEDGSAITGQRELARRCNMPSINVQAAAVPDFNLSHTMDSQPTELHVYLTLRYNVNLYIATLPSNLYWHVLKGTVTIDQ